MKANRFFLYSTILIMLVLPAASIVIEWISGYYDPDLILLIGKWFIFWAVGVRLFTAGLSQILRPAFTAGSIFHLKDKASFAIIRELGIANACGGMVAMISLFIDQWRIPAAFLGGLFLGIAGLQHVIRKPDNPNEQIPMISNIIIFIIMVVYLLDYALM